MLTRVEMIDKLGSFLEGHGFEFKCPEVHISGMSKYTVGEGSAGGKGAKRRSAWVILPLVVWKDNVANPRFGQNQFIHRLIGIPGDFLKFKSFLHPSCVHAPLSAQTLGYSSRLRSRCLSGKGWDTPKIGAKTSVQKSLIVWVFRSVVSDSSQPHGLQHAKFPCPSLNLRACSNHVHRISDAIQPYHPLLSPSPLSFNLSQHRGLFPMSQFFASGSQSIGVFQLQHQSFQWIFRTDFL